MKRAIEEDLLRWKNQKKRMPLLLRGARQVGKTYVIEKLGKEQFEHSITINFELNPEYKNCFKSLEPLKIISSLELVTGVPIEPEKTLLFFDEIQECPQAIMSLRYFKEQMPSLHVIGAGSLLEFILNDSDFKMPVGRVQFMYLRPLSFNEYLEAIGQKKLKEYLESLQIGDVIEDVVHLKLLGLVREYFALGGACQLLFPNILNLKAYCNAKNSKAIFLLHIGKISGNTLGGLRISTYKQYLQKLLD